jgi:hypothetical protein
MSRLGLRDQCQIRRRIRYARPECAVGTSLVVELDRGQQGYRLNDRTPAQALREALGITELPTFR